MGSLPSFVFLMSFYAIVYALVTFTHRKLTLIYPDPKKCSSLKQYFDSLPNSTCSVPPSDYTATDMRKDRCPASICLLIKRIGLSKENCCVKLKGEYKCLTCS